MPDHSPDQAIENSTTTDKKTRENISAGLLDHAYANLPPALAASACLSLLTLFVLQGYVQKSTLVSWLLVIWVISGLRFLLYRFYRRRPAHANNARWQKLFLVGLMAAGLSWGGSGIFLFTDTSTIHQVFLAFILGGLLAGATTSLTALQQPLRVFTFILLAPITIKFFLAGNSTSMTMGIMLLLYGGMCVLMSANIHKILLSALTLRLRNLAEIETRKETEEKLAQYQSNLERQILERTQALSKSNDELFLEILERKKAEDEKTRIAGHLMHAQKMEAIGTMAGGIAHDFNNILSIILGFTELALEDYPENVQLKSDLQKVFSAAQRGKDLVRQIMLFSRNEHNAPIVIKPQELIEEINALLRATIPTTVEFSKELDKDCGAILADPNQIHRVLTNLATNSVHAMEENGILTFSVKEVQLNEEDLAHQSDLVPGAYARISVSDTGCGMNPEMKKHIFEPFFTTKEVGKGTGMGLAVVHGIVSSNQGIINVDSEPGRGTSFHLYFPVTGSQTEKPLPERNQLPMGNERVLVVDDDQAVSHMTSRLLSSQGYQVTTSPDGTEALEKFRAEPDFFDLVITDQTMPGMTGLNLARELQHIRIDIPIIICTGYSSKISDEALIKAGIKKVIMKPYEREELLRTVRMELDAMKS